MLFERDTWLNLFLLLRTITVLKFILNAEDFDLQKYTAKYSGEELPETVLKDFKEAAYKIVQKTPRNCWLNVQKDAKFCSIFTKIIKKREDFELFLQLVYKLSTHRKDVNVITRIWMKTVTCAVAVKEKCNWGQKILSWHKLTSCSYFHKICSSDYFIFLKSGNWIVFLWAMKGTGHFTGILMFWVGLFLQFERKIATWIYDKMKITLRKASENLTLPPPPL